jgi:accessory gene regulator protein AgrB
MMMLPLMLAKPIYESVPYCYILLGAGCLLIAANVIPTLIGLFVFFNGANIWRLRSNARRVDHKVNRKRVKKHYYYYEFKPFILLALSFLLLNWFPHQLITVASLMMGSIALLIIVLRVLNRRSRSFV